MIDTESTRQLLVVAGVWQGLVIWEAAKVKAAIVDSGGRPTKFAIDACLLPTMLHQSSSSLLPGCHPHSMIKEALSLSFPFLGRPSYCFVALVVTRCCFRVRYYQGTHPLD